MPEIKKLLPVNIRAMRYFEPFIGAGALFLAHQPDNAVINDFNIDLIYTYIAIKEHIDQLVGALKTHSKKNSEEYYYHVREQDRDRMEYANFSEVHKAARLI